MVNTVLENTHLKHSHLNPSFFLNMVIKFPSCWKWKWDTFTKRNLYPPWEENKSLHDKPPGLQGWKATFTEHILTPQHLAAWFRMCSLCHSSHFNTNNMSRRQVTCQGPIDSKSWSPGSRPSSSDPKVHAFSIVRSPDSIHLTWKCSTFKTVLQKFFQCSIKDHCWFCSG